MTYLRNGKHIDESIHVPSRRAARPRTTYRQRASVLERTVLFELIELGSPQKSVMLRPGQNVLLRAPERIASLIRIVVEDLGPRKQPSQTMSVGVVEPDPARLTKRFEFPRQSIERFLKVTREPPIACTPSWWAPPETSCTRLR